MKAISNNTIILFLAALIGCQSSNSTKKLDIEHKSSTQNKNINNEPNSEGLRYFMNGQMLMNQGDFAMAIIELQQALTFDPKVSPIHTAIAECYWNIGKPELAKKHLLIAIKQDPQDEQALQMMADQLIVQREYIESESIFKQLNKIDPTNIRYIIALGELLKVKKDFSGAINLYLKAFSLEPGRYELLDNAGRFALQLDDYNKSKSIYKQLSETVPNEERYLFIYIDLLSKSKSYIEGIEHIELLNKKYGETAVRNFQLGLLHYRSGNTDKGLYLIENSINEIPQKIDNYFSLFEIYIDSESYNKAESLSDKLIADFPEDWRGYYSRSIVYMNQNNYRGIITLLGPVSETFRDIYSIQYILGISHNRLKQYDDARNYYERALVIQPSSISLLHSMAILYDSLNEWDKSDKIYMNLIKSDSLDAQAFNNYAYSLVERNIDLKRALSMAKKAISIEPNNASYLDTIGWIYYKLEDLEKAQKFLEASLEIIDDNAVVLEHLGDLMMKGNKSKDAKNYYLRALELDKNNPILIKKASPE